MSGGVVSELRERLAEALAAHPEYREHFATESYAEHWVDALLPIVEREEAAVWAEVEAEASLRGALRVARQFMKRIPATYRNGYDQGFKDGAAQADAPRLDSAIHLASDPRDFARIVRATSTNKRETR